MANAQISSSTSTSGANSTSNQTSIKQMGRDMIKAHNCTMVFKYISDYIFSSIFKVTNSLFNAKVWNWLDGKIGNKAITNDIYY